MKLLVHDIFLTHKNFWTQKTFLAFLGGLVFFVFALVFQHIAYNYIDYHASVTAVGDLLLDHLPTLYLDFFIVQIPLLLTFAVAALLLLYPQYLTFSIKTLSLFIIVRSCFISLTHLGVNLHQLVLDQNTTGFGLYDFLYNSKNDFFFSGHVGTAFLFGLIFWDMKFWRYFFFAASFTLGSAMILAHMHYSIDIFAAPFITYGIFVISKKFFKKDFELTVMHI